MNKIYEKPIFIKTSYVTTDTIADTGEYNEIVALGGDLGSLFAGEETTIIFGGSNDPCSCDECPPGTDFQCGCSC